MGIKRLIQHSSESTKFLLNKKNALLLIENKDSRFDCIYIELDDNVDYTKLHKINNVNSVKFVGPEEILFKISKLNLSWPEFNKEIIVTDPIEAVYYSHNGKVRITKNSISKIATEIEENKDEKKKVLIIDDSKTIQKLLSKIINSSDKLEVMGIADRPSVGKEMIEKERPDLITLDIHMPEMTGVDFLKTYLGEKNIPTVMISSVSMNEGPLVMEALSNGALTYIQKPSIDRLQEASSEILESLETISKVKASSNTKINLRTQLKFDRNTGLIAIGSSTGGTQALQDIFISLPDKIPPIVVVQHIPAVFSKALADRLNTLCNFTVKEAEDGEFLKENTIYIAPGGKQFKLAKRGKEKKVIITDDPPVNRFKPSVDYLFDSIPKLEESQLVGVILTGMGKDGAKGLLKLKESGALTIAQDEATSIVFGMPKEAIRLGAADKVTPLQDISGEIILQYNRIINKKVA